MSAPERLGAPPNVVESSFADRPSGERQARRHGGTRASATAELKCRNGGRLEI